MNVSLSTLILYVQDVKNLKEFYTENFGLQIIEEDLNWVLLNAGGVSIGLHTMGLEYRGKANAVESSQNNAKMVFEIDVDIQIARNNLISKNIRMREVKTFEEYDFWLCDGLDPEGNVFQLKSAKR